jgi:sortase A
MVGTEPAGAAARQTGKATFWRRVGDRLLLLVELAALLGLLLVIGSFLSDLRTLNEETVRVQANGLAVTPTAEPALLPGGNTPPTATDKVPAPFRDLVQAVPVVVIPTPGPQAATRVVIPAIGVDAPVVEGDGWEELKKGVGHHIGSANPGERGNIVLSGHNDVFGEVFRRLTDLSAGDEVRVYDESGRAYLYRVTTRRIVEPTEVSVMRPTSEPILTLITCYPYLVDTQRLIVIAELIE